MTPPVSEIRVAEINDVLFVKVIGKGTMANSEPFYRYALEKLGGKVREVAFDLGECDYLDSTFLGVVAALSKRTKSQTGAFARLVRVSEKSLPYLQTTGLTRVLDCGGGDDGEIPPLSGLVTIDGGEKPDKAEMTRHILMAHKELIDLCESNRDRFKNVIDMLQKSAAKRDDGN